MSPAGRDTWSGRLPEPNAAGDDGPVASVEAALTQLRRLLTPARLRQPVHTDTTAVDGPATILMRGGRYPVRKTIRITPRDEVPVTFRPFEDEVPILDGGERLTGWSRGEVHGRPAFYIDIPDVAAGRWRFRSLFVNGRRASRPRLPKDSLYTIDEVLLRPGQTRVGWGGEGNDRFRIKPGEFDPTWSQPQSIDVVALHFWIDERMPVAGYDPDDRVLRTTRPSYAPLTINWSGEPATYYLDNVFEALTEPGEWYLDEAAGRCWYLPRDGETIDTLHAYAPRVVQLLHVDGDPAAGRFVSWVRFEGVHFEHADWALPGEPEAPLELFESPDPRVARCLDKGSAMQSAAMYPGTIRMRGARHCALHDCTVRHVGWYAVELAEGCHHIRLIGNTIEDVGAGGIKLDGVAAADPDRPDLPSDPARRNGLHRITDNHLHALGRVFHAGAGILAKHSFGNLILHNLIHDLYYTAISVGWTWGYRETVARDNLIAYNHLHDIGQGLLSDMGGIYLLGPQPGTHVHHNLIHDVRAAHYGGWAMYPDEGTSHVTIEHNVCYRTSSTVFHQHFGRENLVRNNIFAFGTEGVIALSKAEGHRSFTLTHNILLSDGKPLFVSGYGYDLTDPDPLESELNLLWDTTRGNDLLAAAAKRSSAGHVSTDAITPQQWQAIGHDRHSRVADPGFTNPAAGDFTLPDDSPATQIGFQPIDLTHVGPRPAGQRG
jgi:hypothetical protein